MKAKLKIKNRCLDLILTDFILLTITILSAFILITVVYFLPVDHMKENVKRSHAIFDYEGVYPVLLGEGYKSSQLDNYTDALMLSTAIYPGTPNETIWEKAMLSKRIEYDNIKLTQSLNDYANDVVHSDKSLSIIGYPRYWHGYLVILKPLLLLFDLADIRCINMILQGALFVWSIYLLLKTNKALSILSFFVMVIIFNPIAEALSLQFSAVYYLTMLSVICILNISHYLLIDDHIYYFFLMIGCLTSFFDLLTYPLVTLGIPLVLFFIISDDFPLLVSLKKLFGCSLHWIIGYAFMWMGKWLAVLITCKINIFQDALREVKFRSSMTYEGEAITYIQVLFKNIRVLIKWPYVLLFLFVGYFLIRLYVRIKPSKDAANRMKLCTPFILISLYPMIWYAGTGNHSYLHYWFTYRNLAITAFALVSMMIKLISVKTHT